MGGAAEGKLYQFSGFYNTAVHATAECDTYDPVKDRWTRIADIPQSLSHAGQAFDSKTHTFWLAGGFLGNYFPGPTTSEAWKFTTTSNSWAAGPPLPAPRAGGALVELGNELHYFGGTTRVNGVYTQDHGTHWVLDLNGSQAWRTTTKSGQILAAMPNPRNHLGGVALNGKIYAIGGQHLGDQVHGEQAEVDVYDLASNTWSLAAPMPRPIGHIMADVFVRGGRIDVVSGVTLRNIKVANVIEYDPRKNSWIELTPLPAAREAPVSAVVGNQIVVTCGALPIPVPHNQTWVAQSANGWLSLDVGSVAAPEEAPDIEDSSFSITGSGRGIESTSDSFHYVYQPLNGDGEIVVNVATQRSAIGTAGLMIRKSTDPDSKHASILVTPDNLVFFKARGERAEATLESVAACPGLAASYWVKLVRSGDILTGYYSCTGSFWSALGSETIPMGTNVLIGLAVSSSSASAVSSTWAFTDLDVTAPPR